MTVEPKLHWCRIVMDERTQQFISNLNYKDLSVLEISGNTWEHFGFKEYKNCFFPDFDICKNFDNYPFKYDLIILEQVLEHIHDPVLALSNIKKLLNKDGVVLITTPFLIRVHGDPNDYWRWTKDGLRILLESNGYSILELDSWGNKDCLIANLNKWARFEKNMNLDNDPNLPLVVWCFAKAYK